MHRRDALRLGAAALGAGVLGSSPSAAAGDYAPLGHLDLTGTRELVVSADGQVGYAAVTDGYATVDLSDPANPMVLAERRNVVPPGVETPTPTATPTSSGTAGTATATATEEPTLSGVYDVKVDGDTLVAVGPAHYDPDVPNGALVVDVADPAAPRHRAFHETPFPIHNCFLDGDHLYLTGNGERIRLVILDIQTGETVAEWGLTDHDGAWSEVAPLLRTIHDVTVQDGVAYLAHWDAGTWLLDVSDPATPRYLNHVADQSREELAAIPDDRLSQATYTPPGNSHYVTPNADGSLLAVGRESWARKPADADEPKGGPSGVDLYDASDLTDLRHLATIEPPQVPQETFDGTWTTSHNFGFRGDVLYTSWYQGGVKRHDVSDPATPEPLTWWRDADRARFWTAQPGVDGEFFVASSMGVRSGAPPGIFTFPDSAGTGGTPLPGGPPSSTPDGTTPTPSPTPSPTASPSPTPMETGTDSPGFGLLAGVLGAGAGVAAWLGRGVGDGSGENGHEDS